MRYQHFHKMSRAEAVKCHRLPLSSTAVDMTAVNICPQAAEELNSFTPEYSQKYLIPYEYLLAKMSK